MNVMVFEHTIPAALIGFGVVLAAAASLVSYFWFVKRTPPTLVILALRLTWLGLLAWCLLLPAQRTHFFQRVRPRFAILLDTSASMQLRPRPEHPSRWDRALRLLSQPWLERLQAQAEVVVHGFDAGLTESRDPALVGNMESDGTSTLLRGALRTLAERYAGLDVAGVLLLSDGLDTREADDGWATEPYPFPLHTVALEPDEPDAWTQEADLRVERVETPRRVTAGWKSELRAVVSGIGTGGQPIRVQLFKDGAFRREQSLLIPAEGGSREARFELDHPETGTFHYRVHAVPLPEERNTDDNDFEVTVQVITRHNHLLYVEGPPRWESRFLSRVLRANPDIAPLVFLGAPDGGFMTIGERGSMTPELQPAQLAFFKIVILGNLDADTLGVERADNLVRYVSHGGSLILLGGSLGWGSDGFPATPLQALLPARLPEGAMIEGEFRAALTDAGRAHAAFAGDPGLWEQVPPVLSIRPGATPGPAASALVEADTPEGVQPLIVVQRYGQGKVAAVLTDSLWHWQMRPDTREHQPYRRFWDQLIAWMMPEEAESDGPGIEVFADREQLYLGETVEISARRGPEPQPALPPPRCEITTPEPRTLPFAMEARAVAAADDAPPWFITRFQPDRPGLYTAVAVDGEGAARVASDPISFYVQPFSPESQPRPVHRGVLRALAENSGGRYYPDTDAAGGALAALDPRARDVESFETRSRWQSGWLLGMLLLLLCAEWALRKFQNMP